MIWLMLVVLFAGIHMVVQPDFYVGRGPIPARSATNVRAMGAVVAGIGGTLVAALLVPILLF